MASSVPLPPRPSIPMAGMQLKVPADMLATLDQEAERLNTTRSGLARHLIAGALQNLSGTT